MRFSVSASDLPWHAPERSFAHWGEREAEELLPRGAPRGLQSARGGRSVGCEGASEHARPRRKFAGGAANAGHRRQRTVDRLGQRRCVALRGEREQGHQVIAIAEDPRAPERRAMSVVSSVEPASAMITSSAHCTVSMADRIRGASLSVGMTTEIGMRG